WALAPAAGSAMARVSVIRVFFSIVSPRYQRSGVGGQRRPGPGAGPVPRSETVAESQCEGAAVQGAAEVVGRRVLVVALVQLVGEVGRVERHRPRVAGIVAE